ncbi:hypothetical protein K505DRAFT_369562, partial [Melanomma pulvis-pyrius CBS 109.77]
NLDNKENKFKNLFKDKEPKQTAQLAKEQRQHLAYFALQTEKEINKEAKQSIEQRLKDK